MATYKNYNGYHYTEHGEGNIAKTGTQTNSYSSTVPIKDDRDESNLEYNKGMPDGLSYFGVALVFLICIFIPLCTFCNFILRKWNYAVTNWRIDFLASYSHISWLFPAETLRVDANTPHASYYAVQRKSEATIIKFCELPFDCKFRFNRRWYKKNSNDTATFLGLSQSNISMFADDYVGVLLSDFPDAKGIIKYKV